MGIPFLPITVLQSTKTFTFKTYKFPHTIKECFCRYIYSTFLSLLHFTLSSQFALFPVFESRFILPLLHSSVRALWRQGSGIWDSPLGDPPMNCTITKHHFFHNIHKFLQFGNNFTLTDHTFFWLYRSIYIFVSGFGTENEGLLFRSVPTRFPQIASPGLL